MPFDGNINCDVVMKKLTNIKYKGPTALEIMNMGYEHIKEPSEFLAIDFERAKRLEDLR
jgi:sugar phosphate isomerase/epimerase